MTGLLNFIKTSAEARKIFGKRELKIIEKQLLGIALTQSEKNRLSRDIRKKLQVIGEISRFIDEFDLKKGAEIKEKIEDAKEIILEDELAKRIECIILYGSAAENRLSFRSDIDIAVKIPGLDLREATLFRKRILGRVNEKLDIQVYEWLDDKIKKEIDVKGKIIWKKAE